MRKNFIENGKITNEFVESYVKTTYRIVGNNKHSALKPCHWFEQRLMTGRENRNCYKGVFGIESHRCLQNTPSLPFCNHQCVFCWRDLESGMIGSDFIVEPDEPKDIVNELIRHQQDIVENHLPLRRYVENYDVMIDLLYFMLKNPATQNIDTLAKRMELSKKVIDRAFNLLKNRYFIQPTDNSLKNYELDGDIKCCIDSREELQELIDRELTTPEDIIKAHHEAMSPNHAAISLDGEPLLYPKISEFVQEFKNRNMSTFIVTNGTLPKKLESLDSLPSQLYITLPACNEQMYKKISRPMMKNGWGSLMSSLEMLDSLSCRKLIRLTAIKELNINEKLLDDYVKIVENANPNFFEIKGFTLQAKALLIKERLKSKLSVQDFFPDYQYLESIVTRFEEISGFSLIYKNRDSRDFLFAVNWDKDKDPRLPSQV